MHRVVIFIVFLHVQYMYVPPNVRLKFVKLLVVCTFMYLSTCSAVEFTKVIAKSYILLSQTSHAHLDEEFSLCEESVKDYCYLIITKY